MKNFVEAYREARAKEWKYMDAKRAGWAEPGKRTRENHAILVPRREAMEMADELDANIYARELYITWAVELRGFMERLAREVDDTLVCGKCGGVLRGERDPGFLQGQPAGALPGSPAIRTPVG